MARSQGILLENREMPRIGNSLKGRRDENIDICRGPKPFLNPYSSSSYYYYYYYDYYYYYCSGGGGARPCSNSGRSSTNTSSPSSVHLAKVGDLSFKGGFCEVKVFLKKIGKNPSKASYWSKKALSRHRWTEADLKQSGRTLEMSTGRNKRKKKGGVPEWSARRKVLEHMCIDFF